MSRHHSDLAIIGGGVIALAIARELLIAHPSLGVTVFEKESTSTAHASGRNSGVLHAGFYYAPDSLKARLTRVGNEKLRAFCSEQGVPVRDCGKVVVTRSEAELPRLEALYERGLANNVPVELIGADRLADLEPLAQTRGLALWSPTTGVADPVAVVAALAVDVQRRGGILRYETSVVAARAGELLTRPANGQAAQPLTRWPVGHIVNCAGLFADRVAEWFGMGREYRVVPFKGVYRYGNWPAHQLTRHVYPVPDPRNPFLGVHATVTVDGHVKIGPTAIPVLGRENYEGAQGIGVEETVDAATGLMRFLRSPDQDAPALVRQELPKYWSRRLAREAAELVPSIRAEDFRKKGRPGIRAQLMNRVTGALEMDFVVQGDADSTHVLNAVSPAWTSSLAFAEHVVAGMNV